jgi:hypothetical protein
MARSDPLPGVPKVYNIKVYNILDVPGMQATLHILGTLEVYCAASGLDVPGISSLMPKAHQRQAPPLVGKYYFSGE